MDDLQRITENEARTIIEDELGERAYNLQYYSWPQVFSNTAGPFHTAGSFAGQAFTEFQMECWTDGRLSLVFSKGRVVRVMQCPQPFTVDWYLSQRSHW